VGNILEVAVRNLSLHKNMKNKKFKINDSKRNIVNSDVATLQVAKKEEDLILFFFLPALLQLDK
jgi:hypothetical protein